MSPIERAVQAIEGGQAALAERLQISPQQVNQWVTGKRPVPARHCRAIEKACGGAVTVHELCSPVFGDAPPATDAESEAA
jgi:DNA-binding transcriptional regulator YdaS (Cro superfamily)